jgi:Coenzyme PQQ synthesis protein D (PqqD)
MASSPFHLRAIVSSDGAAIFDIEHNSISTLNPTGAYVWQGLQQGQSIETVIANLARDTDADPLSVESDVREFVEELQQKRILPR